MEENEFFSQSSKLRAMIGIVLVLLFIHLLLFFSRCMLSVLCGQSRLHLSINLRKVLRGVHHFDRPALKRINCYVYWPSIVHIKLPDRDISSFIHHHTAVLSCRAYISINNLE